MARKTFGPYAFELTHPDKALYPARESDPAVTKAELCDFYRRIAPRLLPHAGNRPLTLRRFPDGLDAGGFFQQRAQDYFPDWIATVAVPTADKGPAEHAVLSRAADLAYMAQLAVLEVHAWLSRADDPERPDTLVLDLDPPKGAGDEGFAAVRRAALHARELLEELGLAVYAKATGSSGLHVLCPIRPGPGFDEARGFMQDVAALLAERRPEDCTTEQRIAALRRISV